MVGAIQMQLGGPLAGSQDRARIGFLGVASERGQLHALLVGCQDVDPDDGHLRNQNQKSAAAHLLLLHCLSSPWWSDPDAKDPACRRVRIPGDEYRPLWLDVQNTAPIKAGGQVFPLLGGWLDHKQPFSSGGPPGETRANASAKSKNVQHRCWLGQST